MIDDVYLKLKKERTGRNLEKESFCEEHVSHISRPSFEIIDASTRNSKAFLSEEVDLFPSELSLHYNSEKQDSYTALINISLVRKMPKSLIKVFTRISVEGNVYEREYEAENNLNTRFKWDGHNVYGQKHYGNAVVTVKVGYRYKLCHNIMWSSHNMKIHAHTPQSTAIGGWNLNIHHVYNHIDGIIYKGNGNIEDMETHEKKVTVLNEQFSKTVISPVTVVAAPDDNLYVGDLKFIRKIDINNKVTNLLQLNESTASHKYYMDITVGFRKYLILSDPVNKRILKIPTEIPSGKNVKNNFEVLVGNINCNYHEVNCGKEGQDPLKQNLIYPKGVTITADNELVFIDGNIVKMYTNQGKVITIAGLSKTATDWKPSKCGFDVKAEDANFNWPTEVAVNFLNGVITIIDQGSLIHLTIDGRVIEISSRNCAAAINSTILDYSPKSLAYSHQGELFIADERNIIHKIDTNNKIEEIAGSMSYCKRSQYGCLQSDFDEMVTVGSKARFQSISSISISSEGTIVVSDNEKHHIRSISSHKATLNEGSKNFEVISPVDEEILIFDSLGNHLETKGLYISSAIGFVFMYSGDRLLEIHDRFMNKIYLETNKQGFINKISLSGENSYKTKINKLGQLDQLISPTGHIIMYKYGSKGLLHRKLIDRKLQYLYQYEDDNGHKPKIFTMVPKEPLQEENLKTIHEESQLIEELYGPEAKFNQIITGIEKEWRNQTVNRIKWDYFIHSARTRSSFAMDVDGIGKKLTVNGEIAVTAELHPRSMIRSLYDNKGIQMLKVEEYGVPKRTILWPKLPYHPVDQTYDDTGKVNNWSWGERKNSIVYDEAKRIVGIKDCQILKNYTYAYDESFYPKHRDDYLIQLDNSGSLEFIMTPSGNKHHFSLIPYVGVFKLMYLPPWSKEKIYFTIDNDWKISTIQKEDSLNIDYSSRDEFSSIKCFDTYSMERLSYKNGNLERKSTSLKHQIKEDIHSPNNNISLTRSINTEDKERNLEGECLWEMENYSFQCTWNLDNHIWTEFYQYNKINNNIKIANSFELIESGQSFAWVNKESNFIIKQERNSFGEIARIEITINNQIAYTKAIEYNCRGQIIKISEIRSQETTAKVTTINYNSAGMLESWNGFSNWRYGYDLDKNIERVNFDQGGLVFKIEAGERIVEVEGRQAIKYSNSGAILKRDGSSFVYNCKNQLVRILCDTCDITLRKEIFYDTIGRPVLIVNHLRNTNVQLVYNIHEERKWEITSWLDQSNKLVSVTNDNKGHMLSFKMAGKEYIVVTDSVKTPYTILDQDGQSYKEITYSPFGALLDETNEDVKIPIGYHGGIDLDEAGVILIKGQPYDTLLGQWMVPDFKSILDVPHKKDVSSIHLYRFMNNDPLNNAENHGPMTSLNEWLSFFDYDVHKMTTSIHHSINFQGLNIPTLQEKSVTRSESIFDANIQRPLMLEKEKHDISIARSFHLTSPVFPNVILTREGNIMKSVAIDGASPVETIMAGLVNKSIILENYGSDLETIYFVKTGGFDEETLQKLKRFIKIEERKIYPHGTEICFTMSQVTLCGLDGIESIEKESSKKIFEASSFVD